MKRKLSDSEASDKQIISFFFNLKNPTLVEKEGQKEIRTYTCICGTLRKQQHKSGYSNLWSHLRTQHPDYAEQYNNAAREKVNF